MAHAFLGVGLVLGTATTAWAAGGPSPSGPDHTAMLLTAHPGPADLYPGSTEGDLTVDATNPNDVALRLDGLRATSIASSDAAACPPSTVTVEHAHGLGLRVPGRATERLDVADVVHLAADAPDGCQGVAFTITLEAEVTVLG